MTTIREIAIPEDQLKLRWREPYVTEGVDKALAVLDPGVYRGGYARSLNPIGKGFRLTTDGEQDNFWLWVDKTTGTALAIRYGADVLVDMSARFTGGGGTIPTTQSWYVWLDCAYSVGGATTGKFYVGDAAPSSANAVKIARISMPAGATEVLDEYISVSTTYRTVAHVDRPLLIPEYQEFHGLSAPKMQLSGKVYCPGGSSLEYRSEYIRLRALSVYGQPCTGSDGGPIFAKKVWANSALSTPVVVDSEGFVSDPWVELDMGLTSDTVPPDFGVIYYQRGTMRDLVLGDQFAGTVRPEPHAYMIPTREAAGTPTSLGPGNLQMQLEALLGAVNDRVKTVAPEAFPSGPVLLWRSHGVTSDASVTGQTISLYWGSDIGLIAIVGGYVTGTTAFRATASPAGTYMVLLRLDEDSGPQFLSSRTGGAASISLTTTTGWDSYLSQEWTGVLTRLLAGVLKVSGDLTVGGDVGVTGGLSVTGGATLHGNVAMDGPLTILLDVLNAMDGASITGVLETLGQIQANARISLMGDASYVEGTSGTGSGSIDTYCRLFEYSGPSSKIRVYYGGEVVSELLITYNARWNDATSKWVHDSTDYNAAALAITLINDGAWWPVASLLRKYIAGFGSGWAAWDGELQWGRDSSLSTMMMARPRAIGDVEDSVRFALGYQSADNTDNGWAIDAVTWACEFDSVPTEIVITRTAESDGHWNNGSVTTTIGGNSTVMTTGVTIIGRAASTGAEFCYYYGRVRAYD